MHIGADAVVFQALADLKWACANAGSSPDCKTPDNFEVGVFSGQYITPVPVGYFERLEATRRCKIKTTDHQQLHTVGMNNTEDVERRSSVAANDGTDLNTSNGIEVRGGSSNVVGKVSRDRQDISLYNLNDH